MIRFLALTDNKKEKKQKNCHPFQHSNRECAIKKSIAILFRMTNENPKCMFLRFKLFMTPFREYFVRNEWNKSNDKTA